MGSEDKIQKFRIVVIGESKSGKTSLIDSYVKTANKDEL